MTSPRLTIRSYRESERPALETMAAEVVHDGTVFPFEDVLGVLDYWLGPGTRAFVACDGDIVVGSYALKPNHPGRGAHVCNAGYLVARDHRRHGVGEAMGRHSLAAARELGYLAMQYNQVVATNTTAVRLWTKLGFRIMATLPRAFRHPELGLVDTHVMFREL